jgi:subtilisin family serine protease
MQRFAALGAVLLTAAACQDATSPRPAAGVPSGPNAAQAGAAGDYIVVFKADESDPDATSEALVRAHGGARRFVYRNTIKGFAVSNLPEQAVEALQRNPLVAYVERDGIMTADASQSNPPWGLDRIDAADGLDQSYTYPNAGAGVRAYILDTGINPSHNDYAGRVATGVDYIDGGTPDDCHGHGTHVAGTVGGTVYGVAKSVTLIAVRVLNCQGSGSTSGVIAGVDWVGTNAIKPAVANMSLGGSYWQALNDAVTAAVAKGVTFAVAAGNSAANACNYSPASTPNAITVGATTTADARASYSNYGPCVDIMAPGSSITSAWIGSASAANTISGTSMASPHVAGAAALVLGNNGSLSPAQVNDALVNNATNNTLATLPTGTPNKLLYVGFIGGGTITPPPPPPPPGSPVAVITKSCNGFTCTFSGASSTGGNLTYNWVLAPGGARIGVSQTMTLGPRDSGTATLTVSNANGTSEPVTASMTCNPKKCQ